MLKKLLTNVLFISTLLLLTMCKINNAQNGHHSEQIIGAKYTNWYGGVKGVRGVNYEFTILSKNNITLKSVVINNVQQSYKISKVENGYNVFIQNTYIEEPPIIGKESSVSKTLEEYNAELPAYIEFSIENTSENKKINLPTFTQTNTPLIP